MKLDVNLEVLNSSIFGSEKSNGKPPSKDEAYPFVSVYNQEIVRKTCQLMIDPVNDLITGKKLIIVPDVSLFFAPFSSFIDEHGCYLSHSYSI